jgi:transaldolase
VTALASPHTVNTMPEKTLLAFADHGKVEHTLAHDGGDADDVLARFAKAGVDVDALAQKLQRDGAAAFVKSWTDLLACLVEKSDKLKKAG